MTNGFDGLDLAALEAQPLAATLKGLPREAVGLPLGQLGQLGLSLLEDRLPLPAAVIKETALQHNLQWMRGFAQRAGVEICPHGKTTMAPQLFDRQLRAGAWGITAATASHVRSYRHFGVPRILLANQLLGRANLDLVFDELEADPALDFYLLVDSLRGLEELRWALRRRPLGRPLQVLLEVGLPRGRCGVRTLEQGLELGRALRAASPAVALRGIETFEGIVSGPDAATAESTVRELLDRVARLAAAGCEEDWFAPGELLLTAGGSAFFDLAAAVLGAVALRRELRPILRSGCYLTHDAVYFDSVQERMRERSAALIGPGPGLRNALEVWAHVLSVPEPSRAICGFGKRDASHDMGLPRPLWWFRPGEHAAPQPVTGSPRVTALNDQHGYVDCDTGPLPWQPGDLVGFGIGHPCTTFDKWPLLYLVDDAYTVVGGVRTFF
jgi:D-serine dehydratase